MDRLAMPSLRHTESFSFITHTLCPPEPYRRLTHPNSPQYVTHVGHAIPIVPIGQPCDTILPVAAFASPSVSSNRFLDVFRSL